MKISYYIKQVYGEDTNYIADPVIALIIQTLTKKKTVSLNDLNALAQLGHEIERVPYNPENHA